MKIPGNMQNMMKSFKFRWFMKFIKVSQLIC